MTSLGVRKHSVSDYPEHLNPFHEEDNLSRFRFWSMSRKKRSNSFSQSISDLRNSWSLSSFRKKKNNETISSPISCISAQNSPVQYRKKYDDCYTFTPILTRNTVSSQPYQYDMSMTLSPRARFQKRVSHLDNGNEEKPPIEDKNDDKIDRSSSSPNGHREGRPVALPGLLEIGNRGSRTSLQSNPFDDTAGSSIRVSTRKKKRAPLPPTSGSGTPLTPIPNITITDTSVESESSVRRKLFIDDDKKDDINIDDPSFRTELKIVEEVDVIEEKEDTKPDIKINGNVTIIENERLNLEVSDDNAPLDEEKILKVLETETNNSDDDDVFKKVNIDTYKRAQSIEAPKADDELKEIKDDEKVADDKNINGNVEHEPKIIKCDMYVKPESTDWELSEFTEFDKVIKDIENTAIAYIDDDEVKPEVDSKQNKVSKMKLLFESNSPNPIPKPRRSKSSSKSGDTPSPTSPVKL